MSSVKCYCVTVLCPLCINNNFCAFGTSQIAYALRISVGCSCTVCVSSPTDKDISWTRKCVRHQSVRNTISKLLIRHCSTAAVGIKLYGISNSFPVRIERSITRLIPGFCARKICVVILGAAVCGIKVTKEDITCTSRSYHDAWHNRIICCCYIILINSSTVCIEGNAIGVYCPVCIKRSSGCNVKVANALHTFIVILCSLAVRCGKVTCKCITDFGRSSCRRHSRCKGCIYNVRTIRTALFVKGYRNGVCNPLCVKCSIFCLIPNLHACHRAIVVLNTLCIIITIEGISCIRIRCDSFRHSRAEDCGNGVSATIRSVPVKCYAISVSFPLCIQGDNITLRCRKVENLVCVIIGHTCSVGVCGPTNKGISNSRKEIRGQALSLVIFKCLIVHRSGCRGRVFVELYSICNRSPLCIQILITRTTHNDYGNFRVGTKRIARIPTTEDITDTGGIFKVNVCRVNVVSVGIVFMICTTI